jgi:hypothetical protein
MGRKVLASQLQAGDVVWDSAMLGDNHPWLVMANENETVTMQSLTSHPGDLTVVHTIQSTDKTGDVSWVGVTSYLTERQGSYPKYYPVLESHFEEVLEPELLTVTMGQEDGSMATVYVPTGGVVSVVREIFSYNYYQHEYYCCGALTQSKQAEVFPSAS